MYSPDQADIDPRNPANFPEAQPTGFYIDPNQFCDDDAEFLGSQAEHTFDNEADAQLKAFAIARVICKTVEITPSAENNGWFDKIFVKPTVKLA
jgi:hypothetical protein